MNQPNPAFKAILDKLPPALHASVIPVLEEWDKGVQARFEELREEYKPYEEFKPFVENNITPDYAWQSVVFADELQRDPGKVAAQINEAFDLNLKTQADFDKAVADAAANSADDGNLFDNEDGEGKVDFTKIPEFAQMQQTLQQLQESEEEKRQREQDEQDLADFNAELDALAEKYKDQPFNRTVVTAFMSQGLDGDAAVKQLHVLLGQDAEVNEDTTDTSTNEAPVTMGNGGNVGSGSEDGAVDWAGMSNSDFNVNVAKVLEAQLGQNS